MLKPAIGVICGLSLVVLYAYDKLKTKYHLSPNERRQAAKMRICIIGCGVSGICAGHFLRLMGVDFVIIEKGNRAGGTWYWNRYPGAGCDVDSHLYSFSWFLNPEWTFSFSLRDEIESYLERAWRYARLQNKTQFNSIVTKAKWNEAESKWEIDINEGGIDQPTAKFDFVISAVGALHKPLIPKFNGTFKGLHWHTANWRDDVSLKGRKVAMIGTGASAVQTLPTLSKQCDQVYLFQRTAHYCLPRFESRFSPMFKQLMRLKPFALAFRWFLYFTYDCVWFLIFGPFRRLKSLYLYYYHWHLQTVRDEEKREKLRASFDLGCKRVLYSNQFYKQLNNPHVSLDNSKIISLKENGIITEDGEYEVDVIIFATGFQLKENFSFIYDNNPEMKNYADKHNNAAYYGLFHPHAPNFATFLGPMTGLGHNSIIFMIECQVQLLINVLRELWSREGSVVRVKETAVTKLLREWENKVDRSVWAPGNCDSFYQRGSEDKRPWLLWPGTTTEFWYRTKQFNHNDFNFE